MVVMGDGGGVTRTLEMTVHNVGFMVDRIGQDCGALQFLRELTQNSVQGILRTAEGRGEVIWDVDWEQYDATGVRKLCVIDTGVGMTGPEMARYVNKLSSSVHEQSASGNYGVGAKIAGATRNHAGMVYLSWVGGEGWMVHLWRDPQTGQYGLKQFELEDGSYAHYVRIDDSRKPRQIKDHGTMVVLLGNEPDADTMQAPPGAASPSRWMARSLNTRYFRYPDGVIVRAREGWDRPRSDKNVNVLRRVTGQGEYLEAHSECSGVVPVSGGLMRWWILKQEKALSQNTGSLASSGHAAALYQDELYEMVTGVAGIARLQQFGVIFGHQRVVLYAEPDAGQGGVVPNTARTHLLLGGEPLPWSKWAAEFRENMPEEIARMMEEIASGSGAADHKRAIMDRLRQIRDLLKPSRYRRCRLGVVKVKEIGEEMVEEVGGPEETETEHTPRPPLPGEPEAGVARPGGGATRTERFFRSFVADGTITAEEILDEMDPDVRWVSAPDGTRTPPDMEDRAAKYVHGANLILINADFRGFGDMIGRWRARYPDSPGAGPLVEATVREWFEQALVETVLGVRSLAGSQRWSVEDVGNALSEEALTAAVMQRYHVDVACKRALRKLGAPHEAPREGAGRVA